METIAENIYKINVDSNVYFLNLNEKILIDTGPRQYKDKVKKELSRIIPLEQIQKVIFTHLHYDHSGNYDLFPKAKFYAAKEEIDYFKNNQFFAIGDPVLAANFNIKLHPLEELNDFEIIPCPGHTKGSICILYQKEKILFSGDTLFQNGIGRTDFPCSAPEKMPESLEKLKQIDYKILAPGHDY